MFVEMMRFRKKTEWNKIFVFFATSPLFLYQNRVSKISHCSILNKVGAVKDIILEYVGVYGNHRTGSNLALWL